MKEGVTKQSYRRNLSAIHARSPAVSRIDITLLGCDGEDRLTENRTENSGNGSEKC